MSVLVDTNVLLRRTQPDHPDHAVAVESIATLMASGITVYVSLQNISEFWNVATRPAANNGLGLSVALTLQQVDIIERMLTLLAETPAQYAEWKRLVVRHDVIGSKVHDAKLAALMNVYGIRQILTFNVGDFARYEIVTLHPTAVVA